MSSEGVTVRRGSARAPNRNADKESADVTDAPSPPATRLTRNDLIEQDRAAVYSRINWAEIYEAREKRDNARRFGNICYRCFRELPSRELAHGEAVYQIKEYGQNVPVCLDCAPKVLAEEGLYIPQQVKIIPAKYRYEWQCSGAACSRSVVFLDQKPTKRSRVFCSRECHGNYGRAKPRLKSCEVCGDTFTAARRDAKTCSLACKQKAYRQRKKEGS